MLDTAVVPGSFDPITTGHLDLIERTARIFSRVIVTLSPNAEKKYMFEANDRINAVRAAVAHMPNVEAVILHGLLADFAAEQNDVLVKGARGAVDFDYEKNLFDINNALSGVDTLILPASKEVQFVSSTFVRELIRYGKPLDSYVPKEAIPFLVRGV